MSLGNFFLIFINTIILVSGQFLWKMGMMKNEDSFDSLMSIIRLFFTPYIFTGLAMYGIATVIWLFILTKVPLSIAYPIQSMAYILAVFGAFFIFKEPLTVAKVVGVLFIMLGVSLIGFSGAKS